MQPVPAYIGCIGTFLILLIFSSGFFWQGPATAFVVTRTFFVPIVVLAAWLILKLLRYLKPYAGRRFAWHTVWPDGVDGLQEAFDRFLLMSGHSRNVDEEAPDDGSATEVPEVVEIVDEFDRTASLHPANISHLNQRQGEGSMSQAGIFRVETDDGLLRRQTVGSTMAPTTHSHRVLGS